LASRPESLRRTPPAPPLEHGGTVVETREPTSRLPPVVRALRPRQWAKNVLVLAAPAAAGVLLEPGIAGPVALAFVSFCLAASGGYLLNDVHDLPSDRHHPRKRRRPIAAGEVSPALALRLGVVLLVAGIGLGFAVDVLLGVSVLSYALLTGVYSADLRQRELLDLAAVAALFVIRVVGGGVAADVPLSRWFLIVVSAGAFFVVTSKRTGERVELASVDGGEQRGTLAAYPESFLRQLRTVSSAIALMAYCGWALARGHGADGPWSELSIVPFALFLLRYSLLVERGHGGAPEDLVLGDTELRIFAGCWLVLFAVGVYAGG
jgi:decaprenyl-phosphate phosphoribosyltransferase